MVNSRNDVQFIDITVKTQSLKIRKILFRIKQFVVEISFTFKQNNKIMAFTLEISDKSPGFTISIFYNFTNSFLYFYSK